MVGLVLDYSRAVLPGLFNSFMAGLMTTNNPFVYADISTYTPRETMAFYTAVFGWEFVQEGQQHFGCIDQQARIGLYETPPLFKQLRMPHFWMSYIQVSSVEETLEKVKALNGIIEMELLAAPPDKVALIRDPAGAGFSIYEGNKHPNARTQNKLNSLIWNELHLADAQKVIPFYTQLFGWSFRQKQPRQFTVYQGKQAIAGLREIPDEIRGKYVYWVCTFGVRKREVSQRKILENGGTLISAEETRSLFADPSGQAFFYIQEVD